MASSKKKGSWIVRARCVVEKIFVCENCTEEEARDDPQSYMEDEQEDLQIECEVLSVKPNE